MVAKLENQLTKKTGIRSILKANASINNGGELIAKVLNGQESFKINPMIEANGWVVVQETDSQVGPFEKIQFYPNSRSLSLF